MTINFKEQKSNHCTVNHPKITDDYQPIDCGLYDYLEIWASHQQTLSITYLLEDNHEKTITAIIHNTLTKNKEEFIVFESQSPIRLDKIVRIIELP